MSDLVLIDFGDSEIKEGITSVEKKDEVQFLYNSLHYSAQLTKDKLIELKNYLDRL